MAENFTYLVPTETQSVTLDALNTTVALNKTGIWESNPKTALLTFLAIPDGATDPVVICLIGPNDNDDTLTAISFISGKTATWGPLSIDDTYKVYAFGEEVTVYYSWNLIQQSTE
jgi:hypothetical protein